MTEEVNLVIDGKPVSVPAGSTILQAAESVGIQIPTICYHDACTANALCRLCVVEVEGARVLAPNDPGEGKEEFLIEAESITIGHSGDKVTNTSIQRIVEGFSFDQLQELVGVIHEVEIKFSQDLGRLVEVGMNRFIFIDPHP